MPLVPLRNAVPLVLSHDPQIATILLETLGGPHEEWRVYVGRVLGDGNDEDTAPPPLPSETRAPSLFQSISQKKIDHANFKELTSAAESAGLIVLGGDRGTAWVELDVHNALNDGCCRNSPA